MVRAVDLSRFLQTNPLRNSSSDAIITELQARESIPHIIFSPKTNKQDCLAGGPDRHTDTDSHGDYRTSRLMHATVG